MKKLKTIIISAITLTALFSADSFAAKSSGQVRYIQQPDGTVLSVRLLGDEHFNWYQTTDGVLLVEHDKCFYIASVDNNGELFSSGIVAHDSGVRNSTEMSVVSSQNKASFFAKGNTTLKNARKAIDGYPSGIFSPHTGTVRVPIILVDYPDMEFTLTRDELEDYFNSSATIPYTVETRFQGYGSVNKYMQDASNGQFNPVFDLYGPYTTDNNHDYYGKNKRQASALIAEVIKKSADDIDYTLYDSNNDGNVDLVYVMYSGTGANISGNGNDVWPCCYYGVSYSTNFEKRINVVGVANELVRAATDSVTAIRAGIGVFLHEMSHGLGLPDLYWTLSSEPTDANGYTDYNNCGPEDWDLMDGGENLYNGMWPCQYAAWERDIMGWLELEELTEPCNITIYPLNKEGGKAYRVTNPENENEYYVIENLVSDEWNYFLNSRYGTGLMITHVNANSHGIPMSPNNTYGKPNVTILPADGFILAAWSAGETFVYNGEVTTMPGNDNGFKQVFINETKGDPYPGSKNITSVAAYKNYTGEEMVEKYPITDITKNTDGSISFKFMGGNTSTINYAITETTMTDNTLYSLDGRKINSDKKSLPKGIYIKNGKKCVK